MSMTPMITAHGHPVVEVRDDVVADYVACVRCKGRGFLPHRVAGVRASDVAIYCDGRGAAIYSYDPCPSCNGRGVWANVETN